MTPGSDPTPRRADAGLVDSIGAPLDRLPDALRAGANAVVFDAAGRILLHRRSDNGWWGLPGGGMEIGESVEECAIRETREETGLEVRVTRLVGVYSDPAHYSVHRYPDGTAVQYLVIVYEAEVLGGELAVSEESTELRFFDPDDLPEDVMLSTRVRVRDTLERRTAAFSR